MTDEFREQKYEEDFKIASYSGVVSMALHRVGKETTRRKSV
jgi:hypothetical protein